MPCPHPVFILRLLEASRTAWINRFTGLSTALVWTLWVPRQWIEWDGQILSPQATSSSQKGDTFSPSEAKPVRIGEKGKSEGEENHDVSHFCCCALRAAHELDTKAEIPLIPHCTFLHFSNNTCHLEIRNKCKPRFQLIYY